MRETLEAKAVAPRPVERMVRGVVGLLMAGTVSLGAATVSAQPRVTLPNLSADALAGLVGGDVQVDVNVDGPTIRADIVGVVNATPERVFAVIRDFAGQENWVPDLYDASVVESSGNVVVGEGNTRLPWPLSDRQWRLRIVSSEETLEGRPAMIARWTLVPNFGNMVQNEGYWLVMPMADDPSRSLVRYRFVANAGISAPDGVERRATRRMLPGILEGLRRQAGAR